MVTIQIKRSASTATPVSLAAGELAYSYQSNGLFIGDEAGTGVIQINGGGGAVDSVNGQTGVVVLTAADVGAAPTVHTHTVSQITDFEQGVQTIITATPLDDLANLDVSAATDGQVLTYDSGTSKWIASTPDVGAKTFVQLTDTPADYTGAAGKLVSVNSTADGLEFLSIIDGGTF